LVAGSDNHKAIYSVENIYPGFDLVHYDHIRAVTVIVLQDDSRRGSVGNYDLEAKQHLCLAR